MCICIVRCRGPPCMVSTRPRGLQRGGTRWSGDKWGFSPDHRVPPRCGPRWGVLLVHIGRFHTCPAGRGRPAAHGTWSSQSAKQPSPRTCSRNDPRTLLIALPQHGLRQPSRLSRLMSGSKTATAACHVAAPRLAAAGAGAGRERRAVGPTDRRTGLQTVAVVLV